MRHAYNFNSVAPAPGQACVHMTRHVVACSHTTRTRKQLISFPSLRATAYRFVALFVAGDSRHGKGRPCLLVRLSPAPTCAAPTCTAPTCAAPTCAAPTCTALLQRSCLRARLPILATMSVDAGSTAPRRHVGMLQRSALTSVAARTAPSRRLQGTGVGSEYSTSGRAARRGERAENQACETEATAQLSAGRAGHDGSA
jgi:hypothetical protein